jgi:serine/threonine protein kinase
MGANPKNANATYEEQLSSLESRLKSPEHDEAMLGDVGLAMRNLLSRNGGSEAHIRQILERQFDQGNLRRESYELVENLLGKIVTEERQPDPQPPVADEPYVDTAVLDEPVQSSAPVATVTNQLQVGSVLRDRYLLKEQVAEGSMGTVYKALDRRLAETGDANPFVAIKVLSPKLSRNGAALRALQQEAAKGRCLSHPNIVRFIDLDREDELFFIVMEWLEGRSLAKILDDNRGSNLDVNTAMSIVRQTARALSYAHQRGVVHADVKPGNIIVTPEGSVKLIDFGVARIRQKENEGKSRFDPNVMRAGSPAYSSMQVLTGEDPVPADDVFSLACLMYRLIAGYRVFGPRNAADAAQEGMEPQQPRELNSAQWQALKKALAYSRVTRYESPKLFMDAFGNDAPAAARRSAQEPATPQQAHVTSKAPEPVQAPQVSAPEMSQIQSMPIGADETTQVAVDSPMRAERDPIMFEEEEEPRRSPLRLIVVGIIIVASAIVVIRPDLLEDLGIDPPLETIGGLVDSIADQPTTNIPASSETSPTSAEDDIEDLEALPEVDVAETTADDTNDNVVEELVIDATGRTVDEVLVPDEIAGDVETDATQQADLLPEPIDFSELPEPDLMLILRGTDSAAMPSGSMTMREDGDAVIVDLIREGELSEVFEVQLVETRFSGNRSPRETGRYSLQTDGLLRFDPGQPRARMIVTMNSNTDREPDSQVMLTIRGAVNPEPDLAAINLTLEDDDQRAFEASLPPNTVGFTINQISVREFDPAVQIDVVRYRPDSTALEVPFILTDVTASEGQDYFAPGIPSVYFGPGQRTARILIPLGQDGRAEQDEAFILELDTVAAPANSNIFSQIAVMIRDDDT